MRSLRGKMLVLILIPVVAIVAVIALLTYLQVKTSFTSTVEEMALEVASKASDIVDEWLNGVVKEVETFADTNAVRNALKTGDWEDLMKNYLPPRLKDRAHIEMAFVAYPDGCSNHARKCRTSCRQRLFHSDHETRSKRCDKRCAGIKSNG